MYFPRLRGRTVIGIASNAAALISIILQPYMPHVSQTIREQICAPADMYVITDKLYCLLPAGHKIGKVRSQQKVIFGDNWIVNIFLCSSLLWYNRVHTTRRKNELMESH